MNPAIPGLKLLVLDMQETLMAALPESGELIARNLFAIRCARLLGLPVAFTEQAPDKLGGILPALLDAAGRAEGEPVAVFNKNCFSAWENETVRDFLAPRGEPAPHILLAGIETPICVYQTAISILSEDGEVTVLTDALGSRRPEDGVNALRALAVAGAHCLPVETIIYSILGTAEHESFREFTRLVKEAGVSA
ncbi:MAG: isochorismatase family protein [Opitutales bacterium]